MSAESVHVRIHRLDEDEPGQLFVKYRGEFEPQGCYVELDLHHGDLRVRTNGIVGGGVPMEEWLGQVRCYAVPILTAAAANALLDELAPLAQVVLDDSEIRWDGSNHVGVVGEEGAAAAARIEAICERLEEEFDLHVHAMDAEDVFGDAPPEDVAEHLGIMANTSDDDLQRIAERERLAAPDYELDVIWGLDEYLEMLRDHVRARQMRADQEE
jgi:hypothetical protein